MTQRIAISTARTNPYSNAVSTADTVAKMRELARVHSSSPLVISACHSALARLQDSPDTPTIRTMDLARCIYWWIKDHVRFVEDDETMKAWGIDPTVMGGRDLLMTPPLLLSMSNPVGDCDDFSTLLASMMICVGFVRCFGRGWFVTIAGDHTAPEAFTHVYTKWELPDSNPRYMYMDASHGLYPGWETNQIYKKEEWII